MTTTESDTCLMPRLSSAGAFLDALAAQDFGRLAETCHLDVRLEALVPRGLVEWNGRDGVAAAFQRWFGDTTSYHVLDAAIGEIGARLQLRWRVRLEAERLGPRPVLVEQQAYADTDEDGLISRIRLVCSGYCAEMEG